MLDNTITSTGHQRTQEKKKLHLKMASETFGTNGRRITSNDDQMHIRNLKDGKEAFNNRKVLKVSGENKGPIKTSSSVFASQYDAL